MLIPDDLNGYINSLVMEGFLDELLSEFERCGKAREVVKDEIILREGQVEKFLYLVKSGSIRVFRMSEHEEINIRFGYKDSIINSLASFVKQQPSELYIQAIKRSEVLCLHIDDMRAFINQNEERLRGYTHFLEMAFAQQVDREIDLLTASPAERLDRVLKRSPNLFQEIPLRHIASYLRMTPETLSRIRKS